MPVQLPSPAFDISERSVAARFAVLKWGDADGVLRCLECRTRLWRPSKRDRAYGCSTCRRTFSVTADSPFEHAKLPLWKIWFLALNLTQSVRPSSRALALALEISVDTAWRWTHRLQSTLSTLPATLFGHLRSLTTRVPVQAPHPRTPPLHPNVDPTVRARCTQRRFITVTALAGTGSWLTHTGEQLQRHLDSLTPPGIVPLPLRNVRTGESTALLGEIFHQVSRVHHGVSARWLPSYTQFAAKRRLAQIDTADALIRQAFRHPKRAFDSLRPGSDPLTDALLANALYEPLCLFPAGQGCRTYVAPSF